MEEKDLMEDKEVGKGSHDDIEEKTSAVKDADFVMQLLGQTQSLDHTIRYSVVNCSMCSHFAM